MTLLLLLLLLLQLLQRLPLLPPHYPTTVAMNRAYTEADKMVLIATHYYVLNISQTLAIIGAFLFMVLVVIPTWTSTKHSYYYSYYSCSISHFFSPFTVYFLVYKTTDAGIMTALMIGFIAILGYIFYKTNTSASRIQFLKTQQFLELVDAQGRLLEKYYPKSADSTPDYFHLVFSGKNFSEQEFVSGIHEGKKK